MKKTFDYSGCVKWLGCMRRVCWWYVRVNFILLMIVFSQKYFDECWFLIRLQRGIKRGSPCWMGPATLRDISEWLWIWTKSCECVHSCALVRVFIPTWLSGNGEFGAGECTPHAQVAHLLRQLRVWSISFEKGCVVIYILETDVISKKFIQHHKTFLQPCLHVKCVYLQK